MVKITRKTVVDCIIRGNSNNPYFPNCTLKRSGDTLFIHLLDQRFKEYVFKAVFDAPEGCDTYYKIWQYLKEHEEIEIIQMIARQEQKLSVNAPAVRKEYA